MSSYSKTYSAVPGGFQFNYYERANPGDKSLAITNNSQYYMIFNFGSHVQPISITTCDYYLPPYTTGKINLSTDVFCFRFIGNTSDGPILTTSIISAVGTAEIVFSNSPVEEGVNPLAINPSQFAGFIFDQGTVQPVLAGLSYTDMFTAPAELILRYVRLDFTDWNMPGNVKCYLIITDAVHAVRKYLIGGKFIKGGNAADVAPILWQSHNILEGFPMGKFDVVTVQNILGAINEVSISIGYNNA